MEGEREEKRRRKKEKEGRRTDVCDRHSQEGPLDEGGMNDGLSRGCVCVFVCAGVG
jgi:hypothetical protein